MEMQSVVIISIYVYVYIYIYYTCTFDLFSPVCSNRSIPLVRHVISISLGCTQWLQSNKK